MENLKGFGWQLPTSPCEGKKTEKKWEVGEGQEHVRTEVMSIEEI